MPGTLLHPGDCECYACETCTDCASAVTHFGVNEVAFTGLAAAKATAWKFKAWDLSICQATSVPVSWQTTHTFSGFGTPSAVAISSCSALLTGGEVSPPPSSPSGSDNAFTYNTHSGANCEGESLQYSGPTSGVSAFSAPKYNTGVTVTCDSGVSKYSWNASLEYTICLRRASAPSAPASSSTWTDGGLAWEYDCNYLGNFAAYYYYELFMRVTANETNATPVSADFGAQVTAQSLFDPLTLFTGTAHLRA